jgi:hypothetical protein
MRRALYFLLFLSLLTGGIWLFLKSTKRETRETHEDRGSIALAAPAAPRMALAIPSRDAGLPPGSPPRDARGEAGQLLMDEPTLMQEIRDSLTRNPGRAEMLAREGRRRFGDSPSADERDMELVFALFNLGRFDRARFEGYYYLAHHPGGRYAKDVSALTGARQDPAPSHR